MEQAWPCVLCTASVPRTRVLPRAAAPHPTGTKRQRGQPLRTFMAARMSSRSSAVLPLTFLV